MENNYNNNSIDFKGKFGNIYLFQLACAIQCVKK